MDLIQTTATIALLTLLAYLIMVNILERTRSAPIKSDGEITAGISNRLKEVPIEGINTDFGFHTRTNLGEPAPPGGENLTQLAVFNEHANGVLPQNHDLFEKPANFGSDVTNINQFYRNNPDIFERSMTTAPDAAEWYSQSQEMFNQLTHEAPNAQINAWNFEKDPP